MSHHLNYLISHQIISQQDAPQFLLHKLRLFTSQRQPAQLHRLFYPPVSLDGLLYHESGLEIREHYTDTAGFTDHVFALMHLLGFAFCPRIRDLHDNKQFIKGKADQYPALQSLISTTTLNLK
ncbi:Transposase and inactivated derivatives, TnpA family [Kluyvera intermedia]|nr:Transposase and inactivated derivatives, TnpA family [Kluyvera intermedia]